MILVAGGQHDINIGVLLRRLLARKIAFRHLLVGPDVVPRLAIDLRAGAFELNGEVLEPEACFVRQDVFLHRSSDVAAARRAAANWYHAVRGWAASRPSIRLFNRHSHAKENNKIHNLLLARECGLTIPNTVVTNDFSGFDVEDETLIQKPVAGGDYTGLLCDLTDTYEQPSSHPRFVQPRLVRPELRLYRVGSSMFAFHLRSTALDYRSARKVEIEAVPVPPPLRDGFKRLCDRLELDFAAADFMGDENGRPHFLEINTQPMFAAFDRVVDGALCDAIIDCLLESAAIEGGAGSFTRRPLDEADVIFSEPCLAPPKFRLIADS
ncbi:MAG: ATP-grasp domain-containing protein [Methyloceanibacter sp.]